MTIRISLDQIASGNFNPSAEVPRMITERFLEAAQKGDLQTIQTLLRTNKDLIKVTNNNRDTSLMVAAREEHTEIVKLILNKLGVTDVELFV